MRELVAAGITVILCVFAFLGGVAYTGPVKPLSAVAFVVCGEVQGVVVTTSDGDTEMYAPGDKKLAEIVGKLPDKSLGTATAATSVCQNSRPRVY